ncbi:uncharacterized protein LOC134239017 [Saccostrea cucullata]|uniref:uncharacterized protein LOC134239017 n=1 Tax=Saccostrea cuccullata TaxID=36930 RepID=UPI002ECFEA5A
MRRYRRPISCYCRIRLTIVFVCISSIIIGIIHFNIPDLPTRVTKRIIKVLERCPFFPSTVEENLKVVENYPFNISETLKRELNLDEYGIKVNLNQTPDSQIVLTSAASSANYLEIQGFISNVNIHVAPKFSDFEFIIFDIGLKKSEARFIKKNCYCRLRKFPFKEYPDHLGIVRTNTWKPVLIQLLFSEFHIVIWADSSVRFLGKPLDNLIHRTVTNGIQLTEGGGSIALRTNTITFKALGEKPCMFDRPELESSFISIFRNHFTLTSIMLPWVSCALQYNCMDFDFALKSITCLEKKSWSYGACHRFDQSVLGIIITRLFSSDIENILFKLDDIAYIKRRHYVS